MAEMIMWDERDICVCLEDGNGEWEYLYVATVHKDTDAGEIIAALQVLFPNAVGYTIEPGRMDKGDPL